MSAPRRVLGYARVSSDQQALGSSLKDQQASIAAYAASRGLTIDAFYVESESGGRKKIEKREQMAALMRDVRKGDLVLVDKIDRWSRDPEFTYRSLRELTESNASFFAVAERIDPSTDEGDTNLNFRVLFAREEHKRIRERTVGTRNLLRDRGYYVEGRTPFGYRRAKPRGYKGVEKNVLVVVPDEATLVRRMFRASVLGKSLNQIASELGVHKDRVHDCLRNRHYLGELRTSKGEWIKGPHEALVSAKLFDDAGRMLAQRKLGGPRPKNAPSETDSWMLRDLARCALCDSKMGAAYAGPKDARRYYYRCLKKCTSRFARVDEAEKQTRLLVLRRLEELREELARGPEPIANAVDYDVLRARLVKRREKHIEAHAEDVITLVELRSQLAKLDAERLRINAEEAASAQSMALQRASVRRATLRELATLAKAWKATGPAERRELLAQLATAVHLHADQLPSPAWRPLEALAADVS